MDAPRTVTSAVPHDRMASLHPVVPDGGRLGEPRELMRPISERSDLATMDYEVARRASRESLLCKLLDSAASGRVRESRHHERPVVCEMPREGRGIRALTRRDEQITRPFDRRFASAIRRRTAGGATDEKKPESNADRSSSHTILLGFVATAAGSAPATRTAGTVAS